MLISHIGIAVKDIDSAIETYKLLTDSGEISIEDIPDQKVKVAIFDDVRQGNSLGGRIELVAAASPDSPIARFLDRHGEGLHHICVYVDDIEKKLAELSAAGVRLIDTEPRIGAGGTRIAFVHPAGFGGVLLELEERRP